MDKQLDWQVRQTPGNTAWFVHDRFGMFIHWGLYAMPSNGEWHRNYTAQTNERYHLYFERFDPDLYRPAEWARAAREAGMRYAVITTKHHDGFCLFDSQYTDFKATNTPAGRDLIAEFVEAFRAEGIHIGFYYSLIDWNHSDFPIDLIHPLRYLPEEECRALNAKRDMKRYTAYMRNQVTELLTRYGKIEVLFFDFSYTRETFPDRAPWLEGKMSGDWEAEKLIALARELQPGVVINNRTMIDQDLWTPEQEQPEQWVRHPQTGERVVWEVCHTFGGSWGYAREESGWKSADMLIQLLIDSVACGGNLLFNVGPTARGEIEPRALERLSAVGRWMRYHSRAIYGCTASPYTPPANARYTQKEGRLYVHLYRWPSASLVLPELYGKVSYAQLLHDASEVTLNHVSAEDGGLRLHLPKCPPDDVEVPVLELWLEDSLYKGVAL